MGYCYLKIITHTVTINTFYQEHKSDTCYYDHYLYKIFYVLIFHTLVCNYWFYVLSHTSVFCDEGKGLVC